MAMKRARALVLSQSDAVRTLLVSALWIGLHLYAGRPLLVAAHESGFAWAGLVAMSFVSLLPLLARRASVANWVGYASMTLFTMLLVLVATTDVLRLGYCLVRALVAPTRVWPLLDPRVASLAILGGAVALTLVGILQARHPRTVHVKVPIENLPAELDGYRIVQWSDVHIGPTIQQRFVECLVERTNALQADAMVITGDLVDGRVEDLRDAVAPLAALRARDGVFFVTGNHEYYWRAGDWAKQLTALGMTFLKNEHRVIAHGDARLVIAGVTDPAGRDSHRPDAAAALRGAPAGAVTVLLAHRPQAAEGASKLGVDLQLSGHTHGGQFFPFNLLIRWFQPVVAGLHRIGRTWLYVSRGTGYWGPPSRLAVGSEITIVELSRG